jgi:hypothetical protein
VLEGCPALAPELEPAPPRRAFVDPDPFREFTFSNRITAKLAIAEALGMPLSRLPEEDRAFIVSGRSCCLSTRPMISTTKR